MTGLCVGTAWSILNSVFSVYGISFSFSGSAKGLLGAVVPGDRDFFFPFPLSKGKAVPVFKGPVNVLFSHSVWGCFEALFLLLPMCSGSRAGCT